MTPSKFDSLEDRVRRLEQMMAIRPGNNSMPAMILPGAGNWDAARRAVENLDEYDYEALSRQDACEREEANRITGA